MITTKDVLNGVAFVLTIFLILYGLNKGFALVELFVNALYFIVIIITLLINLLERK